MFKKSSLSFPRSSEKCVNLQINKYWILLICPLCSDSLRTFEFNFQAFLCNINESWNFHLITFPHLQGKHQMPRCLGSKQELTTLRWASCFSNWFSKTLQRTFVPKIHNYSLLWYICWKTRLEFPRSVSQWHLRCVIHCGGTRGVETCHTSEQVLQIFSTSSALSSSLSSGDQDSEVCCCQEFFLPRLGKRSLTREEREQQQTEKHQGTCCLHVAGSPLVQAKQPVREVLSPHRSAQCAHGPAVLCIYVPIRSCPRSPP